MIKLILTATLIVLTGCGGHQPTEAEMIRNFEEHRSDFERLLEMVRSDKLLQRVDHDWTHPSDPKKIGITERRIEEYRNLFATCSIPRGFEAFQRDHQILFIAGTTGLATGGSSKSYAYRFTPPSSAEIVSALDTYKPADSKSFTIYRRIEGDWYLCYEYDD